MGVATITTFMAIFITTYGCLSLAKDPNVVLLTYWVRASGFNSTKGSAPVRLGHESAFEVYIGLTSMVQKRCTPGTGCFEYELDLIEWWKSEDSWRGSEDGMALCRSAAELEVFCERCRDVAVDNISAAFFACATLLFALYGCINRMKYVSDCPVQKLLGCITDSWGAASLTFMLYQFHYECFWFLPTSHKGYELSYVRGPGESPSVPKPRCTGSSPVLLLIRNVQGFSCTLSVWLRDMSEPCCIG